MGDQTTLRQCVRYFACLAVLCVLNGCGAAGVPSSSSGGSSTLVPIELPSVQNETLQNLAMATNPVVVESANLMSPLAKSAFATDSSNVTAIKIGAFATSDVTSDMAQYACLNVGNVRQAVGAAAMTDYQLCFTKKVLDTNRFPAAYYDNAYHIISYTKVGTAQTPLIGKAKVKAELDANGKLVSFTFFGCDSYGRQTWYSTQTINPTTKAVAITNIYAAPGDDTSANGSYYNQVAVTGVLRDSDTFTSKHAVISRKSLDGNNSVAQSIFEQGATSYTLSAQSGADYTGTFYSGWNYSTGELADFNTSTTDYDPGLLAVGNGANRAIQYTAGSTTAVQYDLVQGWHWNGTTFVPDTWHFDDTTHLYVQDTSSPYVDAVLAATPLAGLTMNDVSIAFTSAQTWDCSGTAEVSATTADVDVLSECQQYFNLWDAGGSSAICSDTTRDGVVNQ